MKVTDKWHRYCLGCGTRHHLNVVKNMDGNECCPGNRFSRDRDSDSESTHDATLTVKDTRHGKLVAWGWSDGRATVTPDEHEEIDKAVATAEERYEIDDLEKGTTVAAFWMDDDETIRRIEWLDGQGKRP